MDGKSALRGGGGGCPTTNDKGHEKFPYFFGIPSLITIWNVWLAFKRQQNNSRFKQNKIDLIR